MEMPEQRIHIMERIVSTAKQEASYKDEQCGQGGAAAAAVAVVVAAAARQDLFDYPGRQPLPPLGSPEQTLSCRECHCDNS